LVLEEVTTLLQRSQTEGLLEEEQEQTEVDFQAFSRLHLVRILSLLSQGEEEVLDLMVTAMVEAADIHLEEPHKAVVQEAPSQQEGVEVFLGLSFWEELQDLVETVVVAVEEADGMVAEEEITLREEEVVQAHTHRLSLILF
jgi:hypothetical protein